MRRISVALSLCCAALSLTAQAQMDPAKPVHIIVPYAAGGPTDTVARSLAQALSQQLKGQPVVVENVGGAGGTLGAGKASKAPADGYTLLLHNIGHATAPAMYQKLIYDPVTDFEPIGLVVNVPMTLIAKPSMAASNYKELVGYLKQNKDKIKIGNGGTGSASHLCGLLLLSKLGVPIQTIAFKGTGPAMKAVLADQIDIMCDQTTNTMDEIKAGKVKVYGVTTKKRIDMLPKVPTLAEQGVPDFEVMIWHGLFAPKGTPKATLDQLVGALDGSLQDPAFKARMAELGAEIVPKSSAQPEALRSFLKSEIDKWTPVIKKAGVYAE